MKKINIIPLGGIEEIGKNSLILEHKSELILIDYGLKFIKENKYGIDFEIPDFSYLKTNIKKLKGIIITHGHLDHIGGLAYLLKELKGLTLYATNLTCNMIIKNLEEARVKDYNIKLIKPLNTYKIGKYFEIEPINMNHSIPDNIGLLIKTPVGQLIHSGDFKNDLTPFNLNQRTNYKRIKEISKEKVLGLFVDSTNSMKKSKNISDKEVYKNLERILFKSKGRVIISTFLLK